jgi:transposase
MAFLHSLESIPSQALYYLDESGFDQRFVHDAAWALKGLRAQGKKQGNRSAVPRISVIGLRNSLHKLVCPALYEGTMNRVRFESYLKYAIETLPPNSVIIMNNASCHKKLSLQDLLDRKACTIKYLPPYSPEFNPIEKLWGSVKRRLKNIYRHVCENCKESIHVALSFYKDIHSSQFFSL